MSTLSDPLAKAFTEGKASGLLPTDAVLPANDDRPWPVTLLTALGAWLAAIPLFGVVYLLLGDILKNQWGPYFTGVLALAGAAVVLRARAVPLFIEQLAVTALLVGGVALGYGLFRDMTAPVAAACLALLALGLAFALPQTWLRVLLGFAAAGFAVVAAVQPRFFAYSNSGVFQIWLSLHAALLVWLAALAVQQSQFVLQKSVRLAAAMESISAGWLLLVLCGLCWWSGMTFLVGGSLGGGLGNAVVEELGPDGNAVQAAGALKDLTWLLRHAGSVVMACAAAFVTARAWPSLRQGPVAVVGLALCALCWFLPAMGAALLALAVAATTRRWQLAAAAALAAAWIVGSFCYQLNWTLANKAALLVALGASMGASSWWAARSASKAQLNAAPARSKHAIVWMGLGVALTLGVANFSIWQKEKLIATGQKVFVELAPADPRSLMQGDFMRLDYRVLREAGSEELGKDLTAKRPQLVVQLDALGVARFVRVDRSNAPLAEEETRMELTPKDGSWTLVSDAWFFREGDAKRWEAARYGEFRVTANGSALLVGLADEKLQPIAINP